MKKSQSGFTLVELVVVIVLLGILGVTALGKFENLSANAADATEQGIASELSSAAAINFAARLLTSTAGIQINAANCTATGSAPGTSLDGLMASGAAPIANLTYAITTGGIITTEDDPCTSGQTFSCSIVDSRGSASNAVASIICTG
jgi:prepilin-type N-terminal cleavage/methylation domain-containing protein